MEHNSDLSDSHEWLQRIVGWADFHKVEILVRSWLTEAWSFHIIMIPLTQHKQFVYTQMSLKFELYGKQEEIYSLL